MSTQPSEFEIPNWLATAVLALVGLSLVYGVVVRGSLIEPVVWWVGVLEVLVGLFVVYLFYRFVLAVEKIADKL